MPSWTRLPFEEQDPEPDGGLAKSMNLRKKGATILRNLLPVTFLSLLIIPSDAQIQSDPQVSYESKHDVSLPLKYLASIVPKPKYGLVDMIEPERNLGLTVGLPGEDTVAQDVYLPSVHTIQLLNFDGIREDEGNAVVPDTNGSVGSTQFVEITNFDYEVFDKATGKVLLQPTNANTIFAGFGGSCAGTGTADPVVLWDKLADRWLVTYFTTGEDLCIAVSTSSDATGSYSRYSYSFGAFPDYPKYAVWPDAYYASFNAYGSGAAEPCAFDRNAMLNGKSKAAMICFTPNNNNFSFLPSDLDGATLPPTGAPNHYVELGNSTNSLDEYDFHVDFAHAKKSTFTGPNFISVPSYSLTCGVNCIPQPSGEELESEGDRLMF